MPPDPNPRHDPPSPATTPRPQQSQPTSIFNVPAPIRRLFDKFPLKTYAADDLPLRAPRNRGENVLFVFIDEEGVRGGGASWNPGCLKWQAYLKFSGIPFRLAKSNNHASPSGALPFLLPPQTDAAKPAHPISSAKLQRWAMDKSEKPVEEADDLRYEAYLSLLDHRIRRAWLYSVYLSPNFTSIAEPLYILPTSTNPFVRLTIARELQYAATAELLKFSAIVDAEQLYTQAEEAFAALETLLGSNKWFFAAERPGLFDASVFAYTHLLLDEGLGKGWVDTVLRDAVLESKGLVAHRERILRAYFQST
ncbi:hypothetical protein P154DRAFT_501023 [Amniculicola lignicola CBS 123094]|uniref:Mitochondrial outer membrane protein n=1 Tax=Amniculicola lignicola CBS 123094 TaxID=1392246 RepID=A0A6A5W128_9PLEO|nr:hypothetical protein P154DRAFT_501023 [Amniculicola lignicola CBS 123094]